MNMKNIKKKLTFQFDPNQEHQADALSNIIHLFEGMQKQEQKELLTGTSEDIVGNFPENEGLDEDLIFQNLMYIQDRNNANRSESFIKTSKELYIDQGVMLPGISYDIVRAPHFTVEMETGTGKTYVYLRTIHELKSQYGFNKFIIVVPSIAIYQGVIKSIEMTRSHFQKLYGTEEISYIAYDSSRLNDLHTYATSTDLTVMIMTIDAFNKVSNNFYKNTEKLPGEWKPYQYVQATRPIVILDEAQNFESPKSKEAIRTLKPLMVLRYSATHRETPNLVYRLTPMEAFRKNLVKQIEVVGVSELDNYNDKILRLKEVTRTPITAVLKAISMVNGIPVENDIMLKQNDDLFIKTKNNAYEGFKVSSIQYSKKEEEQYIEFENGVKLSVVDSVLSKEAIFRAQIERTIITHFEKQLALKKEGIKVLSLFFIDRVKNYTSNEGLVKKLFEESFEKIKSRYKEFKDLPTTDVHEGYFAKPKGLSNEDAIDTSSSTKAQRELEKQAFELIMKNKERLLSFEEPVSFIFAHSALKEGWDNPNVFVICTLNQTNSTSRKRQEIGRGLRLAVDQEGNRIENPGINVLTVVANESYESFVSTLQSEYIEDGTVAPPRPGKAEQGKSKRNNNIFSSREFKEFWSKLNQRIEYTMAIDDEELIKQCVHKLNVTSFPDPLIEITSGGFILAEYRLTLEEYEDTQVKIRVQMKDTAGNSQDNLFVLRVGNDLKNLTRDERFRGFKVLRIDQEFGEGYIKFNNEIIIKKGAPHIFKSEVPVKVKKRTEAVSKTKYPVPDFIRQVANETYLSKRTILEIFKRMDSQQKELILFNPQGWISEFLTQIKITLSDHIIENIQFEIVGHSEYYDLEDLFPIEVNQPQRELIEAGTAGLYNKVQVDSDIERGFVKDLVIPDVQEGNTFLYFKFPPKFKIKLPKIIGNYNPDWGIVRKYDNGKLQLELIRETKGGLNLDQLRFPKEKRKILCAEKYFNKLGISYKVVTDESEDWFK